MELHQLALLCPSAVTSTYTKSQPSHHFTSWGTRPPYLYTRARMHTHKDTRTPGYTYVDAYIAIHMMSGLMRQNTHFNQKTFKRRSAECVHNDPHATWRARRESRWSGLSIAWHLSFSFICQAPGFLQVLYVLSIITPAWGLFAFTE